MEMLPREIVVHIFQYLPYCDIKRCRCVSKNFLKIASERKLWRNFMLIISKSNESKLQEIVNLEIMKDLNSVTFTGCQMTNKHIKLMTQKKIRNFQIGVNHDVEYDCDVRKVSPKLLANLVIHLNSFKMNNSLMSEMTLKQTVAILTQLNKKSDVSVSCLEILFNNHFSCIVPDKLASALASVTELTLVFQKLNFEKYDALFYQLYKNSRLKTLNLPGNNLSKVNPDLFGSAISKLQRANLSDTNINREMIENLFEKITRSPPNSKVISELNISYNSQLKHINPKLFAESICRIEVINLKLSSLTVDQVTCLMNYRHK